MDACRQDVVGKKEVEALGERVKELEEERPNLARRQSLKALESRVTDLEVQSAEMARKKVA